MSNVLPAICAAEIVQVNALPVPGAVILSKGVGASTGILVLQDGATYYITSNALDLESTITKITDLITKLSTTFTHFAGSMAGAGTVPPPALAADLADLSAISAELTALKAVLK